MADVPRPSVLVTDARLGSALAIIRSLGRAGYRVIAADSDRAAPGLHSRYAAGRLVHPPPRSDPDGLVRSLARAAERLGIDLIIPVTDDVIIPLSVRRERIPERSRLALPPNEAISATRDKRTTISLAQELDIPVPATVVVEDGAVPGRLRAVGWPAVVKPATSRVTGHSGALEERHVMYARSRRELADAVRRAGPCLLQAYYPGEAQGVELLTDRGRPLAAFQHRRLREVPVTGGASSYRESMPLDPTMLGYAARLLERIGWTGLAMVEFKVGRDGPKLIEVNGRIWGSLPLAVAAGMDFPAKLAALSLGELRGDGGPDCTYRHGVRLHNLELEAVWVASVLSGRRRYDFLPFPPRREAIRAVLGLLGRGDGFDVLSRDDPRPGMVELLRIARKMGGKIAGGA